MVNMVTTNYALVSNKIFWPLPSSFATIVALNSAIDGKEHMINDCA